MLFHFVLHQILTHNCRIIRNSSAIRRKMSTFASQTHAKQTSQEVGAATRREHYILECVADALFLAIRNYHTRKASQELSRGWCCGQVYTVPVGVPMANHAITHTFRGVLYIPTAWVSLCSFTCLAVVGLESRTSRSQIPRFSFVVNRTSNITSPIRGVWRAFCHFRNEKNWIEKMWTLGFSHWKCTPFNCNNLYRLCKNELYQQ